RFVTRSLDVSSRTARLNSEFEYQHVSRDYSFTTRANKSSPIGAQSDQSSFGTLERLPELEFTTDTINFQRGWLKRVPARFDLGVGQYSEPGSNINTNRVLLGLTLQDFAIARGNTEI